jgi:hypothetical protein
LAVRSILCKTFSMPLASLLRRSSQPTFPRSGSTDARRSTADDSNIPPRGRQASELIAAIRRPWKAKSLSTTGLSNPSQPTPIPPSTSKTNGPTSECGLEELSPPVPAIPGVFLIDQSDLADIPSPEMVPAIGPVPDKLADAWDAVKDDPNIANTSRAVDTFGLS